MNPLGYISKGIGHLLLASMLYMHLCSAWCATGYSGCCGREQATHKEQCHKSCCNKSENHSTGDAKDCQAAHVAFFTTTGQFFSGFSKEIPKTLDILISTLSPQKSLPASHAEIIVAFNGFDPPPPKEEVRILINSFQI